MLAASEESVALAYATAVVLCLRRDSSNKHQWQHHRGITSLMVEGGATVLQSFIDARLYDEVRIETAPITLGSGIKAPTLPAESVSLQSHKAYGTNTIDVFSTIA